jgi:SAM-dependent MidA family methyltransferase
MIKPLSQSAALSDSLRECIRTHGPITFRDWMQAALYDPTNGYYSRSDRVKWGRHGDYRTSPERSSLFAATFARYFAGLFDQLDGPRERTLLEVGAGNGEFAAGVLQTLRRDLPNIFCRTHYVIDEVGSSARDHLLKAFSEHVEFAHLEDVQIEHGIVFSNELLDAFPVHRVTTSNGKLSEFYVDVNSKGEFEWLLAEPSTPRLAKYLTDAEVTLGESQIAEINLEIEDWLKTVSSQLGHGFLITVDYGHEAADLYSAHRNEGTLRGFRRHQFADNVLADPGEQDLTTSIDWSLVKRIGSQLGLHVVQFERQNKFLLRAGLLEQLEHELRFCKTEADKLRLSTAAREMILPDGMAASFQVLVQRTT